MVLQQVDSGGQPLSGVWLANASSSNVAWALRCGVAALVGAPVEATLLDEVYDAGRGANLNVAPEANAPLGVCGGRMLLRRALQASSPSPSRAPPSPSRLPSFGAPGFRARVGVRFAVDPANPADGAAQLAATGAKYKAAADAALSGGALARNDGPFAGYFSALAEKVGCFDAQAGCYGALVNGALVRGAALEVPSQRPGAAVGVSGVGAAAPTWGGAGEYAGIAVGGAAFLALLFAAARLAAPSLFGRGKAAPAEALASFNPAVDARDGRGAPSPLRFSGANPMANPLLAEAAAARLRRAAHGARWGGDGEEEDAGGAPAALPQPAASLAAYFNADAAALPGARAAPLRALSPSQGRALAAYRSPQAASPGVALGRRAGASSGGGGGGGTIVDRAGLARRGAAAALAQLAAEEFIAPGSAQQNSSPPRGSPVLQRTGLSWRDDGGAASVTYFNPAARRGASPGGGRTVVLPAKSPAGGMTLRS
jgi:hypothetical protein